MVSTADVDAGVVRLFPAVVITSVDISKIPVELTEDVFCRSDALGLCFLQKWCQG